MPTGHRYHCRSGRSARSTGLCFAEPSSLMIADLPMESRLSAAESRVVTAVLWNASNLTPQPLG